MTHLPLLFELVVVMGVSLLVAGSAKLLRVPTVVGFLLAGVLIGPGGLELIQDRHNIEVLAEIGVVFLLFTIGLKFSVSELLNMKVMVLGVGGLQVAITVAVVAVIAGLVGQDARPAVFLGTLAALSSTAIVLRLLEERGDIHAPHGRLILAVLIFQDLAVIPMMLFVPLLSGESTSTTGALFALLESVALMGVILVAARWLYPRVLRQVVRTRSRELFVLTSLFVVLGTAWAAGLAGISLALGAFLAGIMISESEYSLQILTEISPLRDAFASLFFISVGMLVDPSRWWVDPVHTVTLVGAVVLVKTLVVLVLALLFGFGFRVATLAGLGLAQIGELSFVLASEGAGHGLIDGALYQDFLSISVLTMALAPFALHLSPRLAGHAQRMAWLEQYLYRRRGMLEAGRDEAPALSGHVIVVGYGVNGRNVVDALRRLGVAYVVSEMNPRTVTALRGQGEAIHYGDATRPEVLSHLGVERARVLVVTIADAASSRQICAAARRMSDALVILVRTRFVSDVDDLLRLGANEVVPEELETSLELAGRVMAAYGIGQRAREREKDLIRQERSGLRPQEETTGPGTLRALLAEGDLSELDVSEGSHAVGRTLRELDLRGAANVLVVAIERDGKIHTSPAPDQPLAAGDTLYLWGKPPDLVRAREHLS